MEKWTEAQITKFIQLYEDNPCLWNTDLQEYKNKKCRWIALRNIVDAMDLAEFNISECKTKIKNLRSHYCQELKKIKNSERSGSNEVYKPSLSWFDSLNAFLRGFVRQKDDVISSFQNLDEAEATNYDSDTINNLLATHSPDFNSKTPKRKKGNKIFLTSALDRLESIIVNAKSQSKTEFDIFGESVAMQLNNMPLADALEMQLMIQQLLTQYRLKMLKANAEGTSTSNQINIEVKSEPQS